ncbi:hypothetical protein CDIK_1912 [Cucumispora dikerogammari]|nr:hypothetical protein CDIK_1912 [Cucumispora dikerogammari]
MKLINNTSNTDNTNKSIIMKTYTSLFPPINAHNKNTQQLCTENVSPNQIFFQIEDALNSKLSKINDSLNTNEDKLLNELKYSDFFKTQISNKKIDNKIKNSEDYKHNNTNKDITNKNFKKDINNDKNIDINKDKSSANDMLKLLDESCSDEFELEGVVESGESEIEFML